MRNANLIGLIGSNSSFIGANLNNALLNGANLSQATLHKANLHKSVLVETYLYDTDFSFADLSEADFSNAYFDEQTSLYKADLRDTIFDGATVKQEDWLEKLQRDWKIAASEEINKLYKLIKSEQENEFKIIRR